MCNLYFYTKKNNTEGRCGCPPPPPRVGAAAAPPRPAPSRPRVTPDKPGQQGLPSRLPVAGVAGRGGEAPSSCVLLLCSMSPSSVSPPHGAPRGPIFTDEEQPLPAGRGQQGRVCGGSISVQGGARRGRRGATVCRAPDDPRASMRRRRWSACGGVALRGFHGPLPALLPRHSLLYYFMWTFEIKKKNGPAGRPTPHSPRLPGWGTGARGAAGHLSVECDTVLWVWWRTKRLLVSLCASNSLQLLI